MKLKLITLVSVFALGLSGVATAGSVTDVDSDGVPDDFDTCIPSSPNGTASEANGPAGGVENQVDTDNDGYGNVCDADWNNDDVVDGLDFDEFVAAFNTANPNRDATGDGICDGLDFDVFVAYFNDFPGPSGLSCAGTIPCDP